jgi:23S rRNA pseudouridine1911/1915/1917 synthase
VIELWQDDDFRAVVKPIGMDVEKEFAGKEWILHRIDTPVSGVLLLARTRRGAEAGRVLFSGRAVQKVYWAITGGALPAETGELTHWLDHAQKGNKSRAHREPGPGRLEATLSFRKLAAGDRYLLWEILLGTGRTHQIRAQLAAEGAPVKGDLKYGFARSNPGGGISLLARSLSFAHPFTGEKVNLVAQPPEGDRLWAALVALVPPTGPVPPDTPSP